MDKISSPPSTPWVEADDGTLVNLNFASTILTEDIGEAALVIAVLPAEDGVGEVVLRQVANYCEAKTLQRQLAQLLAAVPLPGGTTH
jgi:hypothetical protein